MNNTIIRLFLRSEDNRPLSGQTVNLKAVGLGQGALGSSSENGTASAEASANESSHAAADRKAENIKVLDLGTLTATQEGYVSFKSPLNPKKVKSFDLHFVDEKEPFHKISPTLVEQKLPAHIVVVPERLRLLSLNIPELPAWLQPDGFDLQHGEGEVAITPLSTVGDLDCSKLLPTAVEERFYRSHQVVFNENEEPFELNFNQTIYDNSCIPESLQVTSMKAHVADLYEYSVKWTNLGHSLGELLNSFSLAPCEEVNIATMHWTREESLNRSDTSLSNEDVAYARRRDIMIDESMDATLKEKTFGLTLGGAIGKSNSSAGSVGGGVGLANLPFSGGSGNGLFSGQANGSLTGGSITNMGFGGTLGAQTSKTTFTGEATQELTENIRQSATVVRSIHTSTVIEATTSESQVVQTRKVKNRNKCHTLNMMYYEVLRHFEVESTFEGNRKVMLLEYCIDDLTPAQVVGNAHVLKPALLDASLESCFTELAEYVLCCDDLAGGDGQLRLDEITISFRVGNNPLNLLSFPSPPIAVLVFRINTTGGSYTVSQGINSPLAAGSYYSNTFALPTTIDASTVTSIDVGYGWGDPSFNVTEFSATYSPIDVGGSLDLIDLTGINQTVNRTLGNDEQFTTFVADPEMPFVGVEGCGPGECCANKLMNHIKKNLPYYNAVLWLNEDRNARAQRLSAFFYQGDALNTVIGTEPLGVLGNWVAFELLDEPFVADQGDPVSTIVTLPTRGVFSEALLGSCNACETYIDDEGEEQVYRDWDCSNSTPTIGNITLSGGAGSSLIGVNGGIPLATLTAGSDATGSISSLIANLSEVMKDGSPNLTDLEGLIGMLESLVGVVPDAPDAPSVDAPSEEEEEEEGGDDDGSGDGDDG